MKDEGLLLRETNHRCSNDLQLVVSLLALQSLRVENAEAREALSDAMERVAVLARSRAALLQTRRPTLEVALRQVCEALQSPAEPRSVLIGLEVEGVANGLLPTQITTLALIVNELVTNAIKHAFDAQRGGRITVSVTQKDGSDLIVIVDDDGLPFPDINERRNRGLGLGLVPRLLDSIGGFMIVPTNGSKRFEIRVPTERR